MQGKYLLTLFTVISFGIIVIQCLPYSNWKDSNTAICARTQKTCLEITFAVLQYSFSCVSFLRRVGCVLKTTPPPNKNELQKNSQLSVDFTFILTFRHHASYIYDRHIATSQSTLFIYLVNK